MQKIPSDQLVHIGIVVADAKVSAERFSAIYGVAEWAVTNFEPARLSETSTHGFASKHSFRVASGQVDTDLGPVTFRLIEPGEGWSTYKEFLIQRGGGIHHICTGRLNSVEYRELQPWLASEGVKTAQTTRIDGRETYVCLDTRKALGGFYVQLIVSDEPDDQAPADEIWDFAASTSDAPLLPLNTFAPHFGVVVFDLMERVTEWRRLFGITEWNFTHWRTEPGSLEQPTYMGGPVDHGYFTTIATLNPQLAFEIIQPTHGPSHYRENFRDKFGEGIHHVNATFLPDEQSWSETERKMRDRGAAVVMGGGLAQDVASFYYLDTVKDLGYVTEAMHPGSGWHLGASAIEIVMTADLSQAAA